MAAPTQAVPLDQMVGFNIGAIGANSTGTASFLLRRPAARFSAQAAVTGGSGLALVINVSNDGVNWFGIPAPGSLTAASGSTGVATYTTTNSAAFGAWQYVQLAVSTTGTPVTACTVYMVAEAT